MDIMVKTNNGVVCGVPEPGYVVYKGIPYAKPPVGELRWKEPQEPDTWDGVYQADTFRAMCWQKMPTNEYPQAAMMRHEFYEDEANMPEMSEDCLYLNIWVPDHKQDEKLPVAFWIHGGGFGGGYSSEIEFDGEEYCKKGIILVTIAYRLNIFGFLAHPWLTEDSDHHVSGNYGCLDQVAALRWVYDNIEAFGGARDNITVFGQSAGSMSTQILVSSELTGNMIRKAIMQSGHTCAEKMFAAPTLEEEESYGKIFVEKTGVKNLAELRALPVEAVIEAKEEMEAELARQGKIMVIVPNVDGYLLKESVGDAWKNGNFKKIPYMLGCVTDDLGSTPEQIENNQPGILLTEAKRWSRKCMLYNLPTYLYYFSHQLPGENSTAFHTAELWYMMGTLGKCWRPMKDEDFKLSEEMITYWSNFMKTGNPESSDTEMWPAYTTENDFVREFK